MMKWLRALTGGLAAVIALFAAGCACSIYFGWDGEGQMYTVEKIGARLHLLLIPLLIWLALLIVTAVMELRQPKKPVFADKPKYPVQPAWAPKAALAAAGIAGVWMLVYLANLSHFQDRNLEKVVGTMILNIAPAAAVMLAASYFMQKETSPKPEKPKTKAVLAVRIVLAVLAVGCIVFGVQNGGMRDVWVKAINICTECIGLG